ENPGVHERPGPTPKSTEVSSAFPMETPLLNALASSAACRDVAIYLGNFASLVAGSYGLRRSIQLVLRSRHQIEPLHPTDRWLYVNEVYLPG
ncbi:MAG TPA: hypothetical protein VMT53_26015, partial [Terriglobales bacterium]|nr:hypothetical protein [Terriglobales bacterium]